MQRVDRAEVLYSVERKAIRPPEKIDPSDWAERTIELPKGSPPGPVRFRKSRHLVEPLNMIANPWVRQVVLMWPGQTYKTTMLAIALAWWNDQDPHGDALWVMPNKDDAADFNADRFQPILRASPRLSDLFTGRKHDERGATFTSSAGMTTRFRGANSPAGLASWPARRVVLDEADKFKDFVGREADPVSLARVRMKTFPFDSFELCASTPTTTDGLIWREWQQSDQREYHVACVECGEYQVLVTEQVVYPKGASPDEIEQEHLARYRCKYCSHDHDEAERFRMLDHGGVWVPDGCEIHKDGLVTGARPRPSRLGYHMGQLSVRDTPMATYAAEFERSKRDREKLQNFRNSWEGWVWEDTVKRVKTANLRELQLPYKERTVPDGAVFLIGTADTQAREFYYVIRAYGPNRSWLVAEGFVMDFPQLERVFSTRFEGATKKHEKWPVSLVLIDSGGNRTNEVYDYCRPRGDRPFEIYPIKGHTGIRRPYQKSRLDQSLELVTVQVDFFKDRLATLISGTVDGDSEMRWHLHEGPSEGYIRELTAEHKVRDRKSGKEVWKPKTKGRANHRGDCEVYQLAAAEMMEWWALTEDDEGAPPTATEDDDGAPPTEYAALVEDDEELDDGGFGSPFGGNTGGGFFDA